MCCKNEKKVTLFLITLIVTQSILAQFYHLIPMNFPFPYCSWNLTLAKWLTSNSLQTWKKDPQEQPISFFYQKLLDDLNTVSSLIFGYKQWSNGILFSKLFWPTARKNCSGDRKRTLQIWGWRLRICTTTIYWNSEMSVNF